MPVPCLQASASLAGHKGRRRRKGLFEPKKQGRSFRELNSTWHVPQEELFKISQTRAGPPLFPSPTAPFRTMGETVSQRLALRAVGGDTVGPTEGGSAPTNAFLICVIFVINSKESWRKNAFLEKTKLFSHRLALRRKAYFYEGKKNLID